jgi:hypothetical protein
MAKRGLHGIASTVKALQPEAIIRAQTVGVELIRCCIAVEALVSLEKLVLKDIASGKYALNGAVVW